MLTVNESGFWPGVRLGLQAPPPGVLWKQRLFQGRVKSHTLGIPALSTLSQGSPDIGSRPSLESHWGLDRCWTGSELGWLDRTRPLVFISKTQGQPWQQKKRVPVGRLLRFSSSFSSSCLEAGLGWSWTSTLDNLPGEGPQERNWAFY